MTAVLRLQFLGGGKMAEALIGGLLSAGWAAADQLAVVERYPERRTYLHGTVPGLVVCDAPLAATPTLVAVKPQDIDDTLTSLRGLDPGRVLSIAAGITTARLEAALDPGTVVVRCMPNTPALVGKGASAIAGGVLADGDDLDWAASILEAVGIVERVDEPAIDAVTGLSGSGPAYVFLLAELLADAGVAQGLEPDAALRLANQTVIGAARLLDESHDDAATLRANVTSPGGTTAAGLASFAADDLAAVIERAVRAATARSRELGAG